MATLASSLSNDSRIRTRLNYRHAIAAAWIICLTVLALGYGLEIFAALQGKYSADLNFDLFRLDSEGNIPSAYSSLMMLAIAWQMFRASSRERQLGWRTATPWAILGGIFIYLGLDEFFSLHEVFVHAQYLPEFDAFFHFRWVIVGIAFVALVGTVFTPFLLRLPRITAIRLFIAGALFVAGALGLEMVGGYLLKYLGERSVPYSLETIFEESFEDIALVLALRCVLLHINTQLPAVGKLADSAPWRPLFNRLAVTAGIVLVVGLYADLWGDRGFYVKLGVSHPQTLPVWLLAALLLWTATLAFDVAGASGRLRTGLAGGWRILGGVLLFLSADVVMDIHTAIGGMIPKTLAPASVFELRWVLPGIVVAVLVTVSMIPFLARLPRALRQRLVLAGAIFVTGALVLQMLLGILAGSDSTAVLSTVTIAAAQALEVVAILICMQTVLAERHRLATDQALVTAAANASNSG